MDDRRFDQMTRAFGRGLTRRQFAAAVGTALLGLATSTGLTGLTGASAARNCRRPNSACRKPDDCCSGICSEVESTGRSRCLCPSGTESCNGQCVDPAATYLSDPKNCGGCGIQCPRTRCGVGACINGVCGVGPDSSRVGRSCDDGNPCTTNDVCQADGSCAGTTVTCTANEPRCQTAACNPSTGQCETTNLPLGTACADDDRCDGDEACDGNGACAAGTPVQCPQPRDPCQSAVCDPSTGTCTTTLAQDGVACTVFGIPSGVCCSGICSQCCGDASTCTNLFAETVNVVTTCQDPRQVGNLNCSSGCDPDIIPPTNPICTNPAVLGGVNQQCSTGNGQFVTCLNCRLPAGSQCSADTQCCGFCVNGTCQEGAAGSACADNSDCASGLFCNQQSVCAAALGIGSACVAGTDVCTTGTSCGTIIGSNVNTVCCLPMDAACSADEQCCQDGTGAQERCVLGFCKTRGGYGAACGKDFDCLGPLSCVSGICGDPVGLGSACDSDKDCAFDATSGWQPICSGGACRLPNGAATTGAANCVSGKSILCGSTRICGDCCGNGLDPVDCGDSQSERLCCNHECVYRNDTHNCGACGIDCTCGGTDPYRYCTTQYDSQTPSWDWPAVCAGTYTESSGHCTQNNDFCSTTCPPPPAPCDCTQPVNSLFCYASCVGAFPNLELSTCADIGGDCLEGHDDTCCGDAVCLSAANCSPGTVFCLSNDYKCAAP